jgi:glycerate dehydrogenase
MVAPPNIVILDGYTCNPGDLDWREFEALGACAIYDRTPESGIVARAGGAAVLITNKAPLSAATINALPELRYIGVMATGYNIVDVAAARARNIPVCNVPEYSSASVAQATFALLLELTNHIGHHAQTVAAGRWSAAPDFCYWDFPTMELSGLTLGLVGYGRIGQAVAKIARALGMKVIATTRQSNIGKGTEAQDAARFVSLEFLLRESDVLSLHCPLTEQTKQIMNARTLAQMKPSALLLNTARGALVNEAELASALNEGRLAGAGLDVLSVEPPPASNPLLTAKNCLISPHVAWASRPARTRLMRLAAENLRSFLKGQPRNVVN